MASNKVELYNVVKLDLLGEKRDKANNQAMLDDKDIAKRLREAMNQSGVSNKALSDRIGISLQGVGHWLKTGSIARHRIPAIAKALNISIEWLLTGQGPMREPDTESRLTYRQKMVLSLFENLTQSQQEAILQNMKEAKQHNDELYLELRSKYEQAGRDIKPCQPESAPRPERRSGKDRRQNIHEVDFERRSGKDRRASQPFFDDPEMQEKYGRPRKKTKKSRRRKDESSSS